MAYSGTFEYDLFISYAAVDDLEPVAEDGRGWVSVFVHHLEVVLASRLGSSDRLRVFFDRRNLGGNHSLEELLAAVRGSALFLAIASPAYAAREWTRKELDCFVKEASDTRRLFVVDYLRLDDGATHPPPLDNYKRLKFWDVDEAASFTPTPISVKSQVFRNRVHDLADQIKKQLISIQAAEVTRPAISHVAETIADDAKRRSKGVVYLAQSTDDLEEERAQVGRYIEQFGYLVTPSTDLPGGGEAFRAAVAGEIGESDLYVHLLSAKAGRYPSDLPEGYGAAQLRVAQSARKELVLWRHPELNPEAVADERQRTLLTSPSVIACGIESFKAEIRRRLEARRKPEPHPTRTGSLVFINASESDYDTAKIVQQEFNARGMSTVLPLYSGPAEEVHKDLTENMKDCDVLVFLYGQAPPTWVRGQMRLFSKLKHGARATIVAIFVGPPDEKPTDIGFSLPDLRWVNSPREWSLEHLRSLIEEISA
jgi:hypothetical protein